MSPVLLDTDVLSLYLKKGDAGIVAGCARHILQYGRLNLSIITYYEILSGLRHRDARKQLDGFHAFVARNTVLPITPRSADLAAERYAQLRRKGTPVDDIDLLIAGVALEHGLVMVTRNGSHFERIEGLTVEDWSQSPLSENGL
jgi:tRNA(fMet)-specific endonuclease VapC